MEEFKKIPTASAYEVNAEAKVRKVSDHLPIVVSKDGRMLLKKDDGSWDYFVADDLAKELFYTLIEFGSPSIQQEEVDEEKQSKSDMGPEPYREPGKATLKALKKLQKKLKVPADGKPGPATNSILNDDVEKILAKKCSESIKIWKLHQLGCSTKEILAHLKQPASKGHSFTSIIWRFKNNKKRRDKADSI